MAVIRDVMPAFELFQPSSVADAQKLLEQHGPDAWVLAGGLDSFDWLKDRIRKPKAVVDLSGIDELRGVRTTADGIEIGAMTTLTEVVNHPIIKQKYDLLAQAAEVVASPANPQPGNHRRQCFPGHALLVLPRRLAVLPRRRQHLLRRYTGGTQPRTCDFARRPLRCRESFRLCSGSDCARRQIRPAHAQG
jgi:hypothetical protein